MSVAAMQQPFQASELGATIELGPYLSRLRETLAASMIGDSRPIPLKVHVEGGAASKAGSMRRHDNYGFALAAQPGKPQGRPSKSSGSQPIDE